MGNLGLDVISNVRIGKHITLEVDAENKELLSKKSMKHVIDCCATKSWKATQ